MHMLIKKLSCFKDIQKVMKQILPLSAKINSSYPFDSRRLSLEDKDKLTYVSSVVFFFAPAESFLSAQPEELTTTNPHILTGMQMETKKINANHVVSQGHDINKFHEVIVAQQPIFKEAIAVFHSNENSIMLSSGADGSCCCFFSS